MRLIAFFAIKKLPVIAKIILVFMMAFAAVGFFLKEKASGELQGGQNTCRQTKQFEHHESINSSKETEAPIESNNSGWLMYRNKEFHYEVKYPKDWEFKEASPRVGKKAQWEGNIIFGEEVQKVTFLEKEYKLWQGQFRICVYSNSDNLSLELWIAKHEPQDVTGGSLIQDVSEINLGGEPAKRLSIFGFDHEEIEIVTLHQGKIYSVIFAGTNPNDPKVKQHQEIYSQMLSSFTFID